VRSRGRGRGEAGRQSRLRAAEAVLGATRARFESTALRAWRQGRMRTLLPHVASTWPPWALLIWEPSPASRGHPRRGVPGRRYAPAIPAPPSASRSRPSLHSRMPSRTGCQPHPHPCPSRPPPALGSSSHSSRGRRRLPPTLAAIIGHPPCSHPLPTTARQSPSPSARTPCGSPGTGAQPRNWRASWGWGRRGAIGSR